VRRRRVLVIVGVLLAALGLLSVPSAAGVTATSSTSPVSRLRAFDVGRDISVEWTNPSRGSVRRVVVRYARGRTAPADPSTGKRVHLSRPRADRALLEHLKANATYTVAVWTRSPSKRYSRPATVTFTTAPGLAATGSYAGTVTDTAGHPLAHADVYALEVSDPSFTTFTATSDAHGRFRLRLPRGRYIAGASGGHATGGAADATGYTGSWHYARITPHHTRTVAIALPPGGAVTGRVTDANGHPLPGVHAYLADVVVYIPIDDGVIFPFSLPEYETTTAADGTFRFTGVWRQAFLSCYDKSGYGAVCSPASIAVAPGGTRSLADVALTGAPGAEIFGRITDKAGHGLGQSSVTVTRPGKRYPSAAVVTAPDGTYEFFGLAAGAYQLCVSQGGAPAAHPSPTGYAPRCRKAEVTTSPDHSTRVNVALRAGAAVTGTVTGPHHARMAGVNVSIDWKGDLGNGGYATTDRHGHYLVTGLASGLYRACFDTQAATGPGDPTGAAPACFGRRFGLRAGSTRTGIGRQLRAAGAVSGRVLDTAGRPVAGIEVEIDAVTSSSNAFGVTQTDWHGRYTAVGIVAGEYRACVETFDANTSEVQACWRGTLRVQVGHRTRKVDLTVQESASIVASAHDASGRPVSGVNAVVLARCPQSDDCTPQPLFSPTIGVAVRGSDVTGANGAVEFANLKPGKYAVCMAAYYGATTADNPTTGWADRCSGSTFTVVVAKGATATSSQTLSAGGAVTGRVTDQGGHPLAGVVVHVSHSAADDYADYLAASNGVTGPKADSVTGADGTYTIRSVTAGAQTVCFSAAGAHGRTSTGGYLDQCIGGTPGGKNDGTPVTVTARATTSDADLALTAS
jgi:protocatechuate 3,4-dioxygenase beta subunit